MCLTSWCYVTGPSPSDRVDNGRSARDEKQVPAELRVEWGRSRIIGVVAFVDVLGGAPEGAGVRMASVDMLIDGGRISMGYPISFIMHCLTFASPVV